jgi:hypothetical protein
MTKDVMANEFSNEQMTKTRVLPQFVILHSSFASSFVLRH